VKKQRKQESQRYAECMTILVRGDGIAAYCCAHLLAQAGVRVALDRPSRPRVPAIMLSEAAVSLLADVFGHKDLFRDLPRVRSRSVLWGEQAAPVKLPHSAVVVSEQMLLASLRPQISFEESLEPAWTVYASRPLPAGAVEHKFGSRVARASQVDVRNSEGPGCWTESTENGWLFLIGDQDGKGWLLTVGGETSAVLVRSRLIAAHIERLRGSGGEFPSYPRILAPLSADQWLACGTAAIGFDPICGDGTAHAVREAILAAAAIRAISSGANAAAVLAHYESRLTAGFQRHLESCGGFYRAGGSGPWWQSELEAAEQGLAWCAQRMASFPAFRFRLNGYDLEVVA